MGLGNSKYDSSCINDDGNNMGSDLRSRVMGYSIEDCNKKSQKYSIEVYFDENLPFETQLVEQFGIKNPLEYFNKIHNPLDFFNNNQTKKVFDFLKSDKRFELNILNIKYVDKTTLDFKIEMRPLYINSVVVGLRKIEGIEGAMYESVSY